MSNLIRTAYETKKPNKHEAMAYIQSLYEQYPEQEYALAHLAAYFMPSAPKTPKDSFTWVAKAVSTDEVKYHLNFVYVDEGFVIATNGHSMHRCVNRDSLAPGFYCPKTKEKLYSPEEFVFPDYARVVDPVLATVHNHSRIVKTELVKVDKGTNTLELTSYTGIKCHVNQKYYADATSYESGCVFIKSNLDPILMFGDAFCIALLMPIRMPKEATDE